ncbi:hypothetical protein IFR05_002716 [Cadophora sp. M221]|nr:hypothetical protein IFR05_002716 [Cadophora sp. M221]
MATPATTKAKEASPSLSSKIGGLKETALGMMSDTPAAATTPSPSPPIIPAKSKARTSATSKKAMVHGGDMRSLEEVKDGEEEVLNTQAEELARLAVEGEVVMIYDSIWTMEDTDTIRVFTEYQGETVIIKAFPPPLGSDTARTYKAFYKAGPYQAVYRCEKGDGFKLFKNFTFISANTAMVAHFASDPLAFKFVDELDKIWNSQANRWIDTNPYLYLEVHVDRVKGNYFGSWSKRREYNDEVMDPNKPTHLRLHDLDRLWMRSEINMQHPCWSRYDDQTPRWIRKWAKE